MLCQSLYVRALYFTCFVLSDILLLYYRVPSCSLVLWEDIFIKQWIQEGFCCFILFTLACMILSLCSPKKNFAILFRGHAFNGDFGYLLSNCWICLNYQLKSFCSPLHSTTDRWWREQCIAASWKIREANKRGRSGFFHSRLTIQLISVLNQAAWGLNWCFLFLTVPVSIF